jgi:LysM repeat protein
MTEMPEVRSQSVTVLAGETLRALSDRLGVGVEAILEKNKLKVGSIIYPGQTLVIETTPVKAIASRSCLVHGFHKVKAGETVSRIAAAFGTSTQSILTANQLNWNTVIFVGQKLVIPSVHSAADCPQHSVLYLAMVPVAKQIVAIAESLQVADFGIVVALATAAQESGLQNLEQPNSHSVGIFGHTPSAERGTREQLLDAEHSIRAFFGGPEAPSVGNVKGLLDIPNWQSLTLAKAAQTIQGSAHPNAYAKWQNSAWVWLDQLRTNGGSDD